MKISDAIETAWNKYDQCQGPMYQTRGFTGFPFHTSAPNIVAICALGAASIAVEPDELPSKNILARHWPELTRNVRAFPEAYELVHTAEVFSKQWDALDCIAFINDTLRYDKRTVVETVRSWGL
jgi:hypothetical protein